MENLTDSELIARIRCSDEEAFYAFCSRHWKPLYVRLLVETGNKEEAFECVKGLFADLWNRRRQLPDMTTSVEQYLIFSAVGQPERGSVGWNLIYLMTETVLYAKKLLGSSGGLLGDKHFRYK